MADGITLYGIRSHFLFKKADDPNTPENLYEERLIVVKAQSYEDALELGFKEAEHYATVNKMKRLHYVESYEIDSKKLGFGIELYSYLRGTVLDEDEYLKTFFSGHQAP